AQARYHPGCKNSGETGKSRRRRGTRAARCASKLSGKRTEGRSGPASGRPPSRPRVSRPPPALLRMPAMSSSIKPSLRDLEHHDAFVERHIGPNDEEIARMLEVIGLDSLEALTDAVVPADIRNDT